METLIKQYVNSYKIHMRLSREYRALGDDFQEGMSYGRAQAKMEAARDLKQLLQEGAE